jgi:ribosomal protein S4
VKQSRQLIIHGHISVEGAVNRVPGMLVTKNQEKNITYSPSSALNSDLHPVRPGAKTTYDDEEIIETENEEVPDDEPKAEAVEDASEVEEKEDN